MKILVLSNYYPEHSGGIEVVAQNLVSQYRSNGNQVRWIACDIRQAPHIPHPDDHPLKCLNFAEDRLGFPYPLPGPGSLPAIYRDVGWCDVLHLHDCLYAANVLAFVCSRIRKKPVLVTQHVAAVAYPQKYKKVLQDLAYRSLGKMLIRRAERVVFVNPAVRGWFAGFVAFRRQAINLPNGCDTRLFHPVESKERRDYRLKLGLPVDRPVFIFVGRFIEKKGIRIVRQLVAENPDVYWVLVGRQGDDDPRRWKGDNFRVIESLPQISLREYYWAAHLLVLPSHGEGFPLVVQEAMACGTAALISCETFDALRDQNAPLFRAPLSYPEFSQRIDRILANREALDAMRSEAARYAASSWSWEAAAREYISILDQVRVERS